MTDKEKLKEIKKLADVMYYAAQYLTTDASRLHKAMDEYHQFIIHEWREEPVSRDYREIYKNIAQSDAFKSAYENKSLGEVMSVEGEEPVSEKKCMFTKDSYTDEDRKILCKDCDEKCEYNKKEEPVSEEWIKELTTKLDSMSKEDFKKVFDKYAIDFNEDPVSEDLSAENFIKDYTKGCSNLIEYNCGEVLYQPWLTPEDAMRAVEIAREEVMEKVVEWLNHRGCLYIQYSEGGTSFNNNKFIEDFRKAQKG